MQLFIIELADNTTEQIQANCYKQEGPLTTFFAFGQGRQMIDSWSERIASYRTAEIVAIRRKESTSQQRLFSVA